MLSNEAKARDEWRAVAAMGGFLLALLALVIWSVNQQQPADAEEWFSKAGRALAVLGAMGFGIWPTLRVSRKFADSIRFELGEDFVSRRQSYAPEIRLQREEMSRVRETRRGLKVFTNDERRTLFIPKDLTAEGYRAFRDTLSTWAPLTVDQPG